MHRHTGLEISFFGGGAENIKNISETKPEQEVARLLSKNCLTN